MKGNNDQLIELQRQYVASLPGKLAELYALYEAAGLNDWPCDALRSLVHRLHGLSGAAGTFGLQALSSVAARLERQLTALMDSATPPDQGLWLQLGADIKRLAGMVVNAETMAVATIGASLSQSGVQSACTVDLIEDNEDEALYLAEGLQRAGFAVRVFDTGEAYKRAWERPDFVQPTAILMDMVLPAGRLAGADVVKAVKPVGSGIPVIFISQRDDIDARLAAFAAGAMRYFAKPVNVEHLMSVLDVVTGRQPPDPYRVLLVDDEPELLALQAEMLRMAGMKVMTLSNPLETLDVLKVFQPDVLVLDVYMPEVSGPELAAVIRDSDDNNNLPILFLSGETDLNQQLFALSLGGDDFLVKPLRQDHLVAAVSARARRARQISLATDRLLRRERDYEGLVHALDQHGIWLLADETGGVVRLNRRFEQMTGLGLQQVLGQPLLSLPALELTDSERTVIETALRETGVWHGLLYLQLVSGGSTRLMATVSVASSSHSLAHLRYQLIGTVLSGGRESEQRQE
ncbi:MAG: response regulator [Marinobacter sp.]|nr:response regulator [Marinobacter sp.]